MKNFKTYQLAVKLYENCQSTKVPGVMRDQLDRCALSVVLNLAEGSGKQGEKDRRRFFIISFGSLRELQACLSLLKNESLIKQADEVAASLYRLIKNPGPGLFS